MTVGQNPSPLQTSSSDSEEDAPQAQHLLPAVPSNIQPKDGNSCSKEDLLYMCLCFARMNVERTSRDKLDTARVINSCLIFNQFNLTIFLSDPRTPNAPEFGPK